MNASNLESVSENFMLGKSSPVYDAVIHLMCAPIFSSASLVFV